jgi:hypothetical protein
MYNHPFKIPHFEEEHLFHVLAPLQISSYGTKVSHTYIQNEKQDTIMAMIFGI